jgi:hypothetical protein
MLVDRLAPVQWNPSAFGTLVIPDDYRKIIKALVDVHSGQLKGGLIEDVVKGKGDGLIIALHGRPGTGKVCEDGSLATLCPSLTSCGRPLQRKPSLSI